MFRGMEYIPINQLLDKMGYQYRLLRGGPEISNYQTKEQDVAFTHQETASGGCQLTGKRYATKMQPQEDYFGVGTLSDFSQYTHEEQCHIMTNFISELQNKIMLDLKKEANRCGATLCMAVVIEDEIHIMNIGDSRCFLLVWDAEGVLMQCERVNQLHNADNVNEIERIGKQLGIKERGSDGQYDKNKIMPFGRLNRQLALTRALGDVAFESSGLIHEADYFYQKVSIHAGEKAQLLLASDGMVEQWERATGGASALEANQLRILLERKMQNMNTADAIAFEVAKAACEGGSQDNITVLVADVTLQKERANYFYVTDGHNGAAVSNKTNEIFHDTFCACVRRFKEEKGQAASLKLARP